MGTSRAQNRGRSKRPGFRPRLGKTLLASPPQPSLPSRPAASGPTFATPPDVADEHPQSQADEEGDDEREYADLGWGWFWLFCLEHQLEGQFREVGVPGRGLEGA